MKLSGFSSSCQHIGKECFAFALNDKQILFLGKKSCYKGTVFGYMIDVLSVITLITVLYCSLPLLPLLSSPSPPLFIFFLYYFILKEKIEDQFIYIIFY